MNKNTRPTLAMAESYIRSITYTRLPSGSSICCEITLTNMHTVHGIANVVDMENYDNEIGNKASYVKALDKVFEVVAYDMHTAMSNQTTVNKHLELTRKFQTEVLTTEEDHNE